MWVIATRPLDVGQVDGATAARRGCWARPSSPGPARGRPPAPVPSVARPPCPGAPVGFSGLMDRVTTPRRSRAGSCSGMRVSSPSRDHLSGQECPLRQGFEKRVPRSRTVRRDRRGFRHGPQRDQEPGEGPPRRPDRAARSATSGRPATGTTRWPTTRPGRDARPRPGRHARPRPGRHWPATGTTRWPTTGRTSDGAPGRAGAEPCGHRAHGRRPGRRVRRAPARRIGGAGRVRRAGGRPARRPLGLRPARRPDVRPPRWARRPALGPRGPRAARRRRRRVHADHRRDPRHGVGRRTRNGWSPPSGPSPTVPAGTR